MSTAGVWGVGTEGLEAARVMLARGLEVLAVDEVEGPRPEGLDERARFAAGTAALDGLLDCDPVVCSPGIPPHHPFRIRLADAGVTTTSLAALWMQAEGTRTIGVTGTKGKSTTTTLIAALLEAAGVSTHIGGNIGVALGERPADAAVTVAELSSYQCASLSRAPRIAVLTSLYEDHLTWHGSRERYWADKARIFGDGCEVLVCDAQTLEKVHTIGAPLPTEVLVPDASVREQLESAALPGAMALQQNAQNFQLAILAAQSWLGRELTSAEIQDAARSFTPLPHRLELVSTFSGLHWIDDTLSTVPESVVVALEAFPGDAVVIVGGEDRGLDYAGLTEYLLSREPLARLVTVPTNGERIAAGYARAHPELVHRAEDLEDAVAQAASLAPAGASVLLSPGAPSYDRFRNFAHKSEAYVAAIGALKA